MLSLTSGKFSSSNSTTTGIGFMLLGDQAQRVQTLAPGSSVSFCITIFPLKKTHSAAVYTIQAVVEQAHQTQRLRAACRGRYNQWPGTPAPVTLHSKTLHPAMNWAERMTQATCVTVCRYSPTSRLIWWTKLSQRILSNQKNLKTFLTICYSSCSKHELLHIFTTWMATMARHLLWLVKVGGAC